MKLVASQKPIDAEALAEVRTLVAEALEISAGILDDQLSDHLLDALRAIEDLRARAALQVGWRNGPRS